MIEIREAEGMALASGYIIKHVACSQVEPGVGGKLLVAWMNDKQQPTKMWCNIIQVVPHLPKSTSTYTVYLEESMIQSARSDG